jgi:hypothetical protein
LKNNPSVGTGEFEKIISVESTEAYWRMIFPKPSAFMMMIVL